MEATKLVTVLVRSIGERTEHLCCELLKKQISSENIFIISESPFVKTLEKTFEKALEQNRKWTLCIDSDVFINGNFINEIISFAEMQDEDVFLIQGLCFDKFFNQTREVGQRLYRTNVLEYCFQFIKEATLSIRPETYIVDMVRKMGFKKLSVSSICVGVHDYEQSYEDIYRKCFTHTKKHHSHFDMKSVSSFWEKKSYLDNDFLVALQAYKDAINYSKKVFIDKNSDFMGGFYLKLQQLNLYEKKPLIIKDDSALNFINGLLFRELSLLGVEFRDRNFKKSSKNIKKFRRWIFWFRWNKSTKFIRLFGIYFLKKS